MTDIELINKLEHEKRQLEGELKGLKIELEELENKGKLKDKIEDFLDFFGSNSDELFAFIMTIIGILVIIGIIWFFIATALGGFK